jgi:hypothetical protein
MKYILNALCFCALIIISRPFLQAQGCSDAGFCTLSQFMPHTAQSDSTIQNNAQNTTVITQQNQFKIGLAYGQADKQISTIATYIAYNKQWDKLSIELKLSAIAQNGNDIKTFGISDLFVNASYPIYKQLNVSIGTKIPFSKADKQQNGLFLPMDYQASLGTFDLIAGISYTIKKWQFALALQQPLTQNNNQFNPTLYPNSSALSTFENTQQFYRSGDMLLRIAYPFQLKQWTITPSILPIYHLKNDQYTNIAGNKMDIEGSKGITLNTNLYITYNINAKNALQLSIAAPAIVRKNRPDGLTRSLVANIEYRIFF